MLNVFGMNGKQKKSGVKSSWIAYIVNSHKMIMTSTNYFLSIEYIGTYTYV